MLAICIATHKRPVGLERLITDLQALTFERCAEPEIEIVVVDNDPACSAKGGTAHGTVDKGAVHRVHR